MYLLSSASVTNIRLEQNRKGDPFHLSLLTPHLFFVSFRAVYLLWKGTAGVCNQLKKNHQTSQETVSLWIVCLSNLPRLPIWNQTWGLQATPSAEGLWPAGQGAEGPPSQKAAELWAGASSHLLPQWVPGCLHGHGLHTGICTFCVQHFILLMRTDTVCSILHKLGVIHRFLAKSWA